ncbi:hypothetical protein GCM10010313_26020 [Streptomyces violarus]|nr:hypothetical protein GCM10010313_26020 [Streptomyces violarus]
MRWKLGKGREPAYAGVMDGWLVFIIVVGVAWTIHEYTRRLPPGAFSTAGAQAPL